MCKKPFPAAGALGRAASELEEGKSRRRGCLWGVAAVPALGAELRAPGAAGAVQPAPAPGLGARPGLLLRAGEAVATRSVSTAALQSWFVPLNYQAFHWPVPNNVCHESQTKRLFSPESR